MRPNKKRGMTLVELLIASLLGLLVASALLVMVQTTYTAQDTLFGQNVTYARIRQAVDRLADNIRTSQLYPTGVAAGKALTNASISSLTCYTDSSGTNKIQLFLDTSSSPYSLSKTLISSTDSTTYDVVNNVQDLQFTYYVQSNSTFASSTSAWPTTANPNQPTNAELPNVGAVKISVTVNVDGFSRTLTTLVRMRNSPYKTRN